MEAKSTKFKQGKVKWRAGRYLTYPKELQDDAKSNKCTPIKYLTSNFGTPFVYGVIKNISTKKSSAYWCLDDETKRNIIRIYLDKDLKENKGLNYAIKECGDVIENILNEPTGLTIFDDKQIGIRGIMNGFQKGSLFYCKGKTWETIVIH